MSDKSIFFNIVTFAVLPKFKKYSYLIPLQFSILTIGQSNNGYLFGEYTSVSWMSRNNYVSGSQAFLFSVTHKTKHSTQKLPQYAICHYIRCRPCFGNGPDIAFWNGYNYTSNANNITAWN